MRNAVFLVLLCLADLNVYQDNNKSCILTKNDRHV